MKTFKHLVGGMAVLGWLVATASAEEPAAAPARPLLPATLIVSPPAPGPSDASAAVAEPPVAPPSALFDCGRNDCCAPPGRAGWLGGVGLTIVQPYFENNPAFIVNDRIPGTTQVRTAQHIDISTHMEAAPEAWLGYISESGLGGRVRYWYFREGTDQSLDNPNRIVTAHPDGLGLILDNPQSVAVTSKLEMQVADLELLQDLQAGGWDFLLSGGLRLGSIHETYNAYALLGGNFVESLLSGHSFYGIGPVVGLETRRKLGTSGLALYGTARGSILFGSAKQSAFNSTLNDEGTDHRDRGLFTGELEFGLEYSRAVGGTWVFGQVGLVGQDWFGAGSASRSTIQTTPGNDFTGGGYAVDSNIAFLGVALRLGVNY